ncbi:NAD(P)-binding protein [Xylariaceae sp. FL0662B]|nr:NAD(P)-binding protein [Xylariaceae sp. FL0662B]
MTPPNQSRNIVLVGAGGTVGAPILMALIARGHKVSVLTRPDSARVFPASATTYKLDYNDEAAVAAILTGQDALIMALSWDAYDAQIPLIRAAATARVPYVVPTEFGPDATHPAITAELDVVRAKVPYRRLIEELGVSAWIGVANNPWFEYCMSRAAFGVDLKNRTARLRDNGTTKINCTTLGRVGDSLAALLALPDEELAWYKNGWAFFSSFYVSQRDLLESAMRVTGTKEQDWTVTSADSERSEEQAAEKKTLFSVLFREGWGGDYNAKVVDYARLGLEPENLDEAMKALAEELQA